jgi:hypothetical protein
VPIAAIFVEEPALHTARDMYAIQASDCMLILALPHLAVFLD